MFQRRESFIPLNLSGFIKHPSQQKHARKQQNKRRKGDANVDQITQASQIFLQPIGLLLLCSLTCVLLLILKIWDSGYLTFVLSSQVYFKDVVLICVFCPCLCSRPCSRILVSCFDPSCLIFCFPSAHLPDYHVFFSLAPVCACFPPCSWVWLCWICLSVWLNSGFSSLQTSWPANLCLPTKTTVADIDLQTKSKM